MLRAGSWPGHVEVKMSSGDNEYAGGMRPAGQKRLLRMVVYGALAGLVLFLLKVAVSDDFDYAANWVWGFLILFGAFLGGALGLILAGVGQRAPD
jgi:hypothetical protein